MSGWSDIRGIVFDLDDTLYREVDYFSEVFRAFAAAQNLPFETFSECLSDFRRIRSTKKDIFRYVLERAGMHSAELHDALFELYGSVGATLSPTRGTEEWLAFARANDLRLGVLTNGVVRAQRNKWNSLGIDRRGIVFVPAAETGFSKPHADSFAFIARELNLPISALLFIGDKRENDLAEPLRMGGKAILIGESDGTESANYLSAMDLPSALDQFRRLREGANYTK